MKTYSILASSEFYHPEILQFYQMQYYVDNAMCDDIFVFHHLDEAVKYAKMASTSDFLVFLGSDEFLKKIILLVNKPILYVPDDYGEDIGSFVSFVPDYDMKTYISSALENEHVVNLYQMNRQPMLSSFAVGEFGKYLFGPVAKKSENFSSMIRLMQKTNTLDVDLSLEGYYFHRNCISVLVSSTPFVGGIPTSHDAYKNDGKLDVFIIKNKAKNHILSELKDLLEGVRDLKDLEFVENYRVDDVQISFSEPIKKNIFLDGKELLKEEQNFLIESWKKATVMDGKMERTLKR